MIRILVILAASLVCITSAQTADLPSDTPVVLERKLHGSWKGPACGGDWTFSSDGTYLSGTWEVKWNALPPTLVYTCKTSDAPDRIKVGETSAVKLIQLDDDTLAWQHLDQYPNGHTVRYERVKSELR
jgi:hypothetical protein